MSKWNKILRHLLCISKEIHTKKQSILQEELTQDKLVLQKKNVVIGWSAKNKLTMQSITISKLEPSKKLLKQVLTLDSGTKPSNYFRIKALKWQDHSTDRLLNIIRMFVNMISVRNIILKQDQLLKPLKCMQRLPNGNKLFVQLERTSLRQKLLLSM